MATAHDIINASRSDEQLARSWWRKLSWAGQHFDKLQRDIRANRKELNGAPPWELVQRFDPDLQCFIFSFTGVESFPEMWSLQMDDVLNNLRAALDHLAWYLATHGPNPPGNPGAERRVQFPIYDRPSAFNDNIRSCIPGLDATQMVFVEGHQPYKYQSGLPISPLAMLSELNNAGKHREIRLMTVKHTDMRLEVLKAVGFAVSRVELSSAIFDESIGLYEGAEIARIFGVQTGQEEPNLEVAIRSTYTVALSNGITLNDAVAFIATEIVQALYELESTRPELA